ncbi:MAG: single-stranded-DNA-specific exonuclease RecJ [Deltaproteobacteria bacterium]|nr:single-stranded-DNA-specific exonuclease RecJ [Deltaproteobacteria bacterium]
MAVNGAVERRWILKEVDESEARSLASATGLHVNTTRLLVSRGVNDPEAVRRYLEPRLTDMPDPFLLADAEKAAHRLADAVVRGERIALYGDYDVDGVTSTTLMAAFLRMHGVEAVVYIPKRLIEGYGLNEAAVEHLAGLGTQVLVTLDCGITAADEIARANTHGIDVIVVDHHKCPPELPPAYATLNPHQDHCPYPDKVLAAVGVCFNLVVGLRKVLRERGYYTGDQAEPNLRRLLDLVALGSIADMVPLIGVNRLFTWFGMLELRHAKRPGVRALMEVSRVRPVKCDSGDVAFKLGPRINAAGRLDDASVGVRLLLTEDLSEARRLAAALDEANGNRQAIEGEVFRQACELVESQASLPDAIVLANERWHPGVVGIVCSKLVERFDRPAVLIGEGGRGSARSARGLHLYDALVDCAEHLTKFGGHRAAAGMRIPFAHVDAFRAAFLTRVKADPDFGAVTESTLMYDGDIAPEDVNEGWYRELMRLEPFGLGNPEPLFRLRGVRLRSLRVVGVDHLKLRLQEGRFGGLSCIAFKMGEKAESLAPGAPVEMAAHLMMNEFSGLETLELRVRDLRVTA